MNRVQNVVLFISAEVKVMVNDRIIEIQGDRGILVHHLHDLLDCKKEKNQLVLSSRATRRSVIITKSLLGTTRSLLSSMFVGVSIGFVKRLQLVGVGYRAVLEKNIIILNVGFSHAVYYKLPDAIQAICLTPVEIELSSIDKQLIGQVAADLRAIRPPEPFSGKGIRYADELLHIKEVKKSK